MHGDHLLCCIRSLWHFGPDCTTIQIQFKLKAAGQGKLGQTPLLTPASENCINGTGSGDIC